MLYLIFSKITLESDVYRVDYKDYISGNTFKSERAQFPELMSKLLTDLETRHRPVEPLFEKYLPELEKGLISKILTLYNEASKPEFPGRND